MYERVFLGKQWIIEQSTSVSQGFKCSLRRYHLAHSNFCPSISALPLHLTFAHYPTAKIIFFKNANYNEAHAMKRQSRSVTNVSNYELYKELIYPKVPRIDFLWSPVGDSSLGFIFVRESGLERVIPKPRPAIKVRK
ncbi:hypothetical protein L596_021137 [Steinernema carpocapsae]|uniref:Uncharacterized protein n=1 Tax=Steinernema carpocapsae TaxID=34508 RepID=A0A4U5MVL8_STECR|nr:hypothetical protein L596_021137 [Steinernema carpocapsae]